MYKIKMPRYWFQRYKKQIFRFTLRSLLLISTTAIPIFIVAGFSTNVMSEQNRDFSDTLGEMLFKAVEAKSIEVVRTIVKSGVNLSYTNLNGQSAIDIAIDHNYFEIAQFLVFARRLEQRSTPTNLSSVNIIQQSTPESAPIVEISRIAISQTDRRSSDAQKTNKTHLIPTGSQPTYDEFLKTYKNHAVGSTDKKNIIPEPSGTSFKLLEKKLNRKVFNSTKASKGKKTATLIANAKDLNITENNKIAHRPEQKIAKFHSNISDQTHSIFMDIEPRKSFFIPKPRKKPLVTLTNDGIARVTSRIIPTYQKPL